MSKTTSVQFRLPANLRALREVHKATVEVNGTTRRVSFSYYPTKDTYKVSCNTIEEIILIGKTDKGWAAMLCEKVAHKTFRIARQVGGSRNSPKAAFVDAFESWAALQPSAA